MMEGVFSIDHWNVMEGVFSMDHWEHGGRRV